MAKRNVFIVFAHPTSRSFVGALKDVAMETATGHNHKVAVSDLYGEKFDPVGSGDSLKDIFACYKNGHKFNMQADLHKLPEDLQREFERIQAADLVLMMFPMYCLSVPGIMKGWMDRCFIDKLAIDAAAGKWYDNGPFTEKKAMLCFTTGGSRGFFTERGLFGDMDVILWPLHNMIRSMGFQVLTPQICYAPGSTSDVSRQKMLEDWKCRLHNVWTEEPLKFVHLKHFEEENDFQLTDDFVEDSGSDFGLNPGQHLGKMFQQGCMTGDRTENKI